MDAAEELIASQNRAETVRKTIVQSWNEIIAEPDELLVELIAERTEKSAGIVSKAA